MRVLLLLILLLPDALSAQLRTGPRIGLSLATVSAGGVFNWSGLPKPGPMAGWSFESLDRTGLVPGRADVHRQG